MSLVTKEQLLAEARDNVEGHIQILVCDLGKKEGTEVNHFELFVYGTNPERVKDKDYQIRTHAMMVMRFSQYSNVVVTQSSPSFTYSWDSIFAKK